MTDKKRGCEKGKASRHKGTMRGGRERRQRKQDDSDDKKRNGEHGAPSIEIEPNQRTTTKKVSL